MKLVVHIGPDTLAFDKYKSKGRLVGALESAITRGISHRKDSLDYSFAGRKYSRIELQQACNDVMTWNEYFKQLRDWYKD